MVHAHLGEGECRRSVDTAEMRRSKGLIVLSGSEDGISDASSHKNSEGDAIGRKEETRAPPPESPLRQKPKAMNVPDLVSFSLAGCCYAAERG